MEVQVCKIDCLVHKLLQVSKQAPSMFFELCRWHGDERIVHGIGSHFENRVAPFRVIEVTDWIILHDLREELFRSCELRTNFITTEGVEDVAPLML